MGLYLAIFDDGDELDGVEVGDYADFSAFRDAVVDNLEERDVGSRFPTLVLHSDCEGEWSPREAADLEKELVEISVRFRELPPIPLRPGWQEHTAKTFGIQLRCLYDNFFDIDGEPLLERLISLAKLSQVKNLPILFQ